MSERQMCEGEPRPVNTTPSIEDQMATLRERVAELELRVQQLERTAPVSGSKRSGTAASAAIASLADEAASWTRPYRVAQIEASETWIEIHEHSARPQLQRLIREVIAVEAPATERLVLDRVRRAWGLRRAGGRVQEAFDQAVRQLIARGLLTRLDDALIDAEGCDVCVRVPGEDEATKRGAEEVPIVELQQAIVELTPAEEVGRSVAADDVTMAAAKLFGWTRRGGAIQERLNQALRRAQEQGLVGQAPDGGLVRVSASDPSRAPA